MEEEWKWNWFERMVIWLAERYYHAGLWVIARWERVRYPRFCFRDDCQAGACANCGYQTRRAGTNPGGSP